MLLAQHIVTIISRINKKKYRNVSIIRTYLIITKGFDGFFYYNLAQDGNIEMVTL